MKLNKNYSCLLASIIGNLPESLILVTLPYFTRLLRTQSTLACVSCAGPVACLGWTVGQHDLEPWFSKFQAELQPPRKHKIFRRWYSRCSSIFGPLWNATLAWSSKGIHGEMRFLYRFSLAIWQTHKPTPISAKMRMIQHVLRDLELDQKSLNCHLCTSPY